MKSQNIDELLKERKSTERQIKDLTAAIAELDKYENEYTPILVGGFEFDINTSEYIAFLTSELGRKNIYLDVINNMINILNKKLIELQSNFGAHTHNI